MIAGCADGSCGLSARLPGTSSASAAEPIVISWLHDATAPVGAGRVVVGGACVAKGYAADMKHRGFELQPELSRALLLTKLDSFFARVHISNPKGNAAEALPVFVTMRQRRALLLQSATCWLHPCLNWWLTNAASVCG